MNRLKHRRLFAALAALCWSVPIAAAGLDAADAGDYVWLHPQTERPLPTQMRLFLHQQQWMMDGKQGAGDWQPVCRGSGNCRLQVSAAAEVRRFKEPLNKSGEDFCSDILCQTRRLLWLIVILLTVKANTVWRKRAQQKIPSRLIQRFLKATLPAQWQAYPFACIHNVALAFCRASDQNRRAYWTFTLVGGRIIPIPLNRVR